MFSETKIQKSPNEYTSKIFKQIQDNEYIISIAGNFYFDACQSIFLAVRLLNRFIKLLHKSNLRIIFLWFIKKFDDLINIT